MDDIIVLYYLLRTNCTFDCQTVASRNGRIILYVTFTHPPPSFITCRFTCTRRVHVFLCASLSARLLDVFCVKDVLTGLEHHPCLFMLSVAAGYHICILKYTCGLQAIKSLLV